jgi:sucrose phosphorylase
MHANGDNRSINRRQWQSDELEALLSKKNHHSEVLSKLKALLAIRIKQPAFHPNATQFTLHLGESIFGFWRQSIDRSQSIFCISNITPKKRALPLSAVNLIETENWFDLISGTPLSDYRGELQLAPYQTLWITNSKQAAK